LSIFIIIIVNITVWWAMKEYYVNQKKKAVRPGAAM